MLDPPSAQEILPDLAEAVRHFGMIDPAVVIWLGEKLAEHWNENPERTLAREYPDLLAKYANVDFPLATQALELIVRRAMNRWYLARDYTRCRRDLASRFFVSAVELLIKAPRVCCASALALDGVLFSSAQNLPTLPLPSCDFEFCGCDYRALSHSDAERRNASLGNKAEE